MDHGTDDTSTTASPSNSDVVVPAPSEDEDEDDTQLALTGAARDTANPLDETELVHAWSIDNVEEPTEYIPRRSVRLPLLFAALVVAVAGSIIAYTMWPKPAVHSSRSASPSVVVPPKPLPPATPDQKFLAALAANGILSAHPASAIEKAHMICTLFDRGVSVADMMAGQQQYNDAHPTAQNLPGAEFGIFLSVTVENYCPQYVGNF